MSIVIDGWDFSVWCTTKEAGERLGCSEETLNRYRKAGLLHTTRNARGKYRYSAQELDFRRRYGWNTALKPVIGQSYTGARVIEGWDFSVLLTPAQGARILSCSTQTISRWAEAGKLHSVRLPGIRKPGHRRFSDQEVRHRAAHGWPTFEETDSIVRT